VNNVITGVNYLPNNSAIANLPIVVMDSCIK